MKVIDVRPEVKVALDGERVTIATVELLAGSTRFKAAGGARRDEHDSWSDRVGTRIALGRALRDIGHQLIREGMREVR